MADKRLIIKLFNDAAPLTCDFFRSIVTYKRNFDYQGSAFNFLLPNKYITGGDLKVVSRDGSSIHHPPKTEKPNPLYRHDKKGVLSMGHDTSTTFLITLGAVPHLDQTHIVIGHVIEGMEIFDDINKNGIIRGGGQFGDTGASQPPADYPVISGDVERAGVDVERASVSVGDAELAGAGAGVIHSTDKIITCSDVISKDIEYGNKNQIGGKPVDEIIIYSCGEINII